MGWQFLLIIGAAAIMVAAWTSLVASTGILKDFDEAGFKMRTIAGERFVPWVSVRGPAHHFERFFPRIEIARADRSLFRLYSTHAVLLRGQPSDAPFYAYVKGRLGMKDIVYASDLFEK